jgi:Tol biopolymer transport system component
LIAADSQVKYVDPGYLLYMRNGDLVMQPFDPRSRSLGGQPVHVPEPVSLSTRLGRAIFSSARSDVLAYEAEATPTELVWYDRFGRRLGVLGKPGLYTNPALAPDGRRAAVTRFDPSVDSSDIWIIDSVLGDRALTATTASEDYPIWSANGQRVIYASDSPGRMKMFEKPADSPASTADAVAVNDTPSATDDNWPLDWAPRGAVVVFQGANAGIPRRLLALHTADTVRKVVPVDSTSASTGVLQEEAQAQVSPDGRWIAYTADLGRSPQIFVKAFPSGANVTQISTAGGFEPKWRGDGRELFYVAPDRTIMSATLECQSTCDVAPPVPLFRVAALGAPLRKGAIRNEYAVTRDGQRFLVNEPVDGTSAYGIRIVVNWQAGVTSR